jgi:hypothetical protein
LRPPPLILRAAILAPICFYPIVGLRATTAIVLRSPSRIVLAADSRVVYSGTTPATECKLFEVADVYATVSGIVHYAADYRLSDVVRDGFAGPGTFPSHVSTTAYLLEQRAASLLNHLQTNNPAEYRRLTQSTSTDADFVQLAVAQTVNGHPMLGIVELRRAAGNRFTATTTVCPGNCRSGDSIFYLGYWDRIRPYVADSGQPRNVASAASLDRLIRMEMKAHPAAVGAPINILELNATGARWLQNGGNCSLPGVSW